MRIGIGYDVHRLVSNRKLILGGVEIAYEKGLEGHSDADVLVHAIMDALLGALALGSIGDHFPDSDPGYKNADSLKLLEQVLQLADQKGYQVGNVDSVLICQSPKLKNYISAMRQNIANCLRTDPDNIAVKATTTEQLGFEGKGQGIAAQAVVMLQSKC